MFSAKTLAFLEENHIRDSRVWFGEHKKEYRSYVLEPLRELVTALTPVMLELDGQFVVEPRVDKTICRIWRDTRFSHDPSLYRESMWVIFKRVKCMQQTIRAPILSCPETDSTMAAGFTMPPPGT
jgi:uncharacterized protein (DUF2461 family)